jgi:hypothetical protein
MAHLISHFVKHLYSLVSFTTVVSGVAINQQPVFD